MIFKLLLLVACATFASASPMWQDLFISDCEYALHFFPQNPLVNMGLSGLGLKPHDVIEKFTESIRSHAACHCPELSDTELNEQFGFTFANILRLSEGDESAFATECEFSFYNDLWYDLDINLNFPKGTCTYQGYLDGEACTFQLEFDSVGVALQFGITPCSDYATDIFKLPSLSISCQGDLCSDLFLPCSSDSDCTGDNTCNDVDGFYADAEQFFSDLVVDMGMWGDNEVCTYDGNTITTDSIGQEVTSKIMQGIATIMKQPNAADHGFCGVDRFFDNLEAMGTELSDLYVEDEENGGASITIPAWNGELADGSNVADADRLDGSAFPSLTVDLDATSGEVVMLHRTCDNRMGLNPNSPHLNFQGRMQDINQVVEIVWSSVENMMQCKSGGAATDDDVTMAWNPINLGFWLNILSTQARDYPYEFGWQMDEDLHTMMMDELWSEERMSLLMPEDCDPWTWEHYGYCELEYTYLSELFSGEELTLKAKFEQCDNAVPQFTLTCVGDICSDLIEPYIIDYCTSDNDCSGSRTCTIADEETFGEDFIAGLMWDVEEECTYSDYGWSSDCTIVDECARTDKFQYEIFNVIMSLTDQDEVEMADVPPGWCQSKWETALDVDNADTWAEDAFSGDCELAITGLSPISGDVCDAGCSTNGWCIGADEVPTFEERADPVDWVPDEGEVVDVVVIEVEVELGADVTEDEYVDALIDQLIDTNGGTEDDYTVTVTEQEDGTYIVDIEFVAEQGTGDDAAADVADAISDPSSPVNELTEGDVTTTTDVSEETNGDEDYGIVGPAASVVASSGIIAASVAISMLML